MFYLAPLNKMNKKRGVRKEYPEWTSFSFFNFSGRGEQDCFHIDFFLWWHQQKFKAPCQKWWKNYKQHRIVANAFDQSVLMPTGLAVSTGKWYHCFITLKLSWLFWYLLEVNKVSKAEGSQALTGFPTSSQKHEFLPERLWRSKCHLRSTHDVFAFGGIGSF